jgi:hypothetical protein
MVMETLFLEIHQLGYKANNSPPSKANGAIHVGAKCGSLDVSQLCGPSRPVSGKTAPHGHCHENFKYAFTVSPLPNIKFLKIKKDVTQLKLTNTDKSIHGLFQGITQIFDCRA